MCKICSNLTSHRRRSQLWTFFTHCSSVFIIFEKVNCGWSITNLHPKRVEDSNPPLIFEIVQPANKIICCWQTFKKETIAQVISCEFCEIFKNTYRAPLDHCFWNSWGALTLSTFQTRFPKQNLLFPEAVAQRCSVKKVFLEIAQNSQENTCARVSFLIKLQASGVFWEITVLNFL